MMDITVDSGSHSANVLLAGPSQGTLRRLSSTVLAYVDHGDLTALEIIDTTQFGEPFDVSAAERAVEWAREQLARSATG